LFTTVVTHFADPLLDGICVQWKDGSTSWQSLKDLKEAYPIAVAEYAVAQGIDDEPAFNWWVPHVLCKREQIIALVKKRSTHFLKKRISLGSRCRDLSQKLMLSTRRTVTPFGQTRSSKK
jgi:hypothetical protein